MKYQGIKDILCHDSLSWGTSVLVHLKGLTSNWKFPGELINSVSLIDRHGPSIHGFFFYSIGFYTIE